MRKSISLLTLVGLAAAGAFAASARARSAGPSPAIADGIPRGKPAGGRAARERSRNAVAKSPDNADLWGALGNAYMSQLGSMYQSPDPAAMIAVGERARDAYARGLALDQKNALLLASHGMAG